MQSPLNETRSKEKKLFVFGRDFFIIEMKKSFSELFYVLLYIKYFSGVEWEMLNIYIKVVTQKNPFIKWEMQQVVFFPFLSTINST